MIGFGRSVIWISNLTYFYSKNLSTWLPSLSRPGNAQPRTVGSGKEANRSYPPGCGLNSNRCFLTPLRGVHYHSTTVCVVNPPVDVIGHCCYCMRNRSDIAAPLRGIVEVIRRKIKELRSDLASCHSNSDGCLPRHFFGRKSPLRPLKLGSIQAPRIRFKESTSGYNLLGRIIFLAQPPCIIVFYCTCLTPK